MTLTDQLKTIAEQIAGEIKIDVTYLVSAANGTTLTGSGETAEIALAAFISGVLEEQADAEHVSADRVAERAGLPIAPGITAWPAEAARPAPTNGQSPAPVIPMTKRGAQNRALVRAGLAQGESARALATRLGLAYSTVRNHIVAIEREAAGAGPEATFRG